MPYLFANAYRFFTEVVLSFAEPANGVSDRPHQFFSTQPLGNRDLQPAELSDQVVYSALILT